MCLLVGRDLVWPQMSVLCACSLLLLILSSGVQNRTLSHTWWRWYIIQLLGFCLHNTYFSFQGQFHKQVEGEAMGIPVSPIMVNLYMEHFERKALSSATTPRLWMRYVDNTFVIQQEEHQQIFLEHIIKVTLPSSLQWKVINRLVLYHSWILLWNLRQIIPYHLLLQETHAHWSILAMG